MSPAKPNLFLKTPSQGVSYSWCNLSTFFILVTFTTLSSGCLFTATPASQASPSIPFCITGSETVKQPVFTQGLVQTDKYRYVSGGGYGKSTLQKQNIHTGDIVSIKLPENWFSEGIALTPEGLWLLTWKKGIASLRDRNTLKEIKRVKYRGQGWGLATSPTHLIMSNGSAELQLRNPNTFTLEKTMTVTENGTPVSRLNELEYIDGYLYANIWRKKYIVKIDINTGYVLRRIDLSKITLKHKDQGVTNGISWSSKHNSLTVTGKNWDSLYHLKLHCES